MRPRFLLVAGLALAVPFLVLRAQDDPVQQRFKALKALGEEKPAADGANAAGKLTSRDAALFSNNLSQLEVLVGGQDYEGARRVLRNWIMNTQAPQIRKALEDLSAELEKIGRERYKQQLDKIAALVSGARTSAQATEAGDAVQALQDEINRSGGNVPNSIRQQLEGANQAVREWRAILQFEEQGRPQMALQRLRNLEQNNYTDLRVLPSAILVAKRASLIKRILDGPAEGGSELSAEVDRVVAGIKGGADLAGARAKVERLQRVASYEGDSLQQSLYRLMNDLSQLEALWRQAQGGAEVASMAVISWRGGYGGEGGHPWQKPLAALREALVTEVVQSRFEVGDLAKAKGADLGAKLEGLADQAFEKSEWARLQRVLGALRFASGLPEYTMPGMAAPRGGILGETAAVGAFVSGQNLEQAGQYAAAAECYREVLRQSGKRVPTKPATERLLAITKEHPEVAKEGAPR